MSGFAGEAGGVAGLGDNVGGDEGSDSVDFAWRYSGRRVVDVFGDLCGEVIGLAVEVADVADTLSGYAGSCFGAAAPQVRDAGQGFGPGEFGGDLAVVAAAVLLQVCVESVDLLVAGFGWKAIPLPPPTPTRSAATIKPNTPKPKTQLDRIIKGLPTLIKLTNTRIGKNSTTMVDPHKTPNLSLMEKSL